MIDITPKNYTKRSAIAQSIVRVSRPETIERIKDLQIPKGNVLEAARTAALFAVKNTPHAIPDCHVVPIEFTQVHFELTNDAIQIQVEVGSIYKTGLEMEALYGASIASLTMYDMLKPIDKHIVIEQTQLISKTGGKSDYSKEAPETLRAHIVVCSDSISAGKKKDVAGITILEKLAKYGVCNCNYAIIPDDPNAMKDLFFQAQNDQCQLLIYCGGTGISPRDKTPDTIRPLIETELPGIAEQIRNYGQQRTPYAMLSRSFAGMTGNMLVLGLPGSTRGAAESIDAVFPAIFHIFETRKGKRHD